MTGLTHDKTYRFLMLLFLAVIALSSILIIIELQSPKVIEVRCTQANNETYGDFYQVISYYSDGSFNVEAQKGACYTGLQKYDGKNYPNPSESTATTLLQPKITLPYVRPTMPYMNGISPSTTSPLP